MTFVEKEIARGEAAKQLQKIAEKFPDLLEQFAGEFLRLQGSPENPLENDTENNTFRQSKRKPTEAIDEAPRFWPASVA